MTKVGATLCAAVMLAGLASGARAQQPPPAEQAQPHTMPKMLDQSIFAHLLFDQLDGRFGFNQGNTFRWEAQGWLGTDKNRIRLLSEGRYSDNQLDDGIHQMFYGRAITTYFDAVVGVRYDLDSLPGRGWGRSASRAWPHSSSRCPPLAMSAVTVTSRRGLRPVMTC